MRRKPIIMLLAILAACVLVLSGCASKFKCDMCGEEKTGKQYKVNVYGRSATLCEKCNATLNTVNDSMNSLFGIGTN